MCFATKRTPPAFTRRFRLKLPLADVELHLACFYTSNTTLSSRDTYFDEKKEGMCLPDLAVLQSEDSVQEYQEANQSSGKQHSCVPAKPGKVQTDLFPEIPPETAAEERCFSRTINTRK